MFKGLLVYVAAALALSGCVVGQQINMDYTPAPKTVAENGVRVQTVVLDEREEVASGKKDGWFVGTYRGGFGNTFNVANYEKLPLAQQMERDLKEELKSLGYLDAANGKKLEVRIKEWSFDGYINAEMWYEVVVSVFDASGKSIYGKALKERFDFNNPSILVGPKRVLEREVPIHYREMLHAIVRNNKDLLAALK